MKPYLKQKRTLALGLSGALAVVSLSAGAASFTYTNDDLLLAFRVSGSPDLVVDIGQVSVYEAVASGATIPVTTSPTTVSNLLKIAYSSLDNLNWSVSGSQHTPGTFPLQTIWVTSPRSDVAVQATPWYRNGQFVQGNPASQISAIGVNAATYSSIKPASSSNTITGVVIPANNINAYTPLIKDPYNSSESNLGGKFGGNIENTTPYDFDSGEPLSVSDLYELQPGGGAGTYVGYFSFNNDGTVTFTAASSAPANPQITSVIRAGNVTTVSFTTQSSHTYNLISTNLAGLTSPKSSWPATGASIAGTGAVLSLSDTNSASAKFYAIQTQ